MPSAPVQNIPDFDIAAPDLCPQLLQTLFQLPELSGNNLLLFMLSAGSSTAFPAWLSPFFKAGFKRPLCPLL
jgi:hypothetical protein